MGSTSTYALIEREALCGFCVAGGAHLGACGPDASGAAWGRRLHWDLSECETVRDLRQARGRRLGAMQRKFPRLGIVLLYILALLELAAFPLLGAGTAVGAPQSIFNVQGALFGGLCGATTLVLRFVERKARRHDALLEAFAEAARCLSPAAASRLADDNAACACAAACIPESRMSWMRRARWWSCDSFWK